MNEESQKLEQVKKSCKAAKTCAKVLFVLCVVGCVSCLVGAIMLIACGKMVNAGIEQALSDGADVANIGAGRFKFASFDMNEDMMEMESSIPALNDYLQSQNGNYALMYSLYCLAAGVVTGVLAVALKLLHSVFVTIEDEGTPFADAVLKKMLIAMIMITVLIFCSSGTGFGVISAFITWAIYSIMDYGRALQNMVDETL